MCEIIGHDGSMNGSRIVARFGGVRAMARQLAIPVSTVQSWKAANKIPSQHLQYILDMGAGLDPPLTADEFFAAPSEDAA